MMMKGEGEESDVCVDEGVHDDDMNGNIAVRKGRGDSGVVSRGGVVRADGDGGSGLVKAIAGNEGGVGDGDHIFLSSSTTTTTTTHNNNTNTATITNAITSPHYHHHDNDNTIIAMTKYHPPFRHTLGYITSQVLQHILILIHSSS